VFSDHIIDTIDFSRPPSEIVMRLANLKEGRGGTALFDALMYSAKLLRPSMAGDAIYLISDGGENASQTRLREVKRELLASGIRMFAFRLTDKYFRAATSEPMLLEDLTSTTGGAIVHFEGGPSAREHDHFHYRREAHSSDSLYRVDVPCLH
jgi:hypothetical protein